MIPRETIDKIHAAAKIEEVVSDYVTLRKRGANLIGLCPFHNEKTGSFTVSPSKGIYKCFGCGASGHALKFIMEIEQCSFVEAVKQLGKKYHIEVEDRELTAEEQQRQDNRESMFVVNEFANKWFQSQLWETPEGQAIGMSYFHERGLRDDIIRKYQLGYSPEKGNPLAKALKEQGFKEEFITNNVDTKIGVGVVGKSEDGRLYDRFRDRVIFPIFTVSGKRDPLRPDGGGMRSGKIPCDRKCSETAGKITVVNFAVNEIYIAEKLCTKPVSGVFIQFARRAEAGTYGKTRHRQVEGVDYGHQTRIQLYEGGDYCDVSQYGGVWLQLLRHKVCRGNLLW